MSQLNPVKYRCCADLYTCRDPIAHLWLHFMQRHGIMTVRGWGTTDDHDWDAAHLLMFLGSPEMPMNVEWASNFFGEKEA
jgi:hypothetical protein